MNHFKRNIFALTAAAMMVAGVVSAMADSFNCTNTLNQADTNLSWPTNSIGTNGLPRLTGGPVNLQWATENAGFSYCGYATGTSNGNLIFYLVRSWWDNTPTVSALTTNMPPLNAWEQTPSIILTVPISAGIVSWGTNLSKEVLGGANWIGIYAVTNTISTLSVTNLANTVGQGANLNIKVNGVRLR